MKTPLFQQGVIQTDTIEDLERDGVRIAMFVFNRAYELVHAEVFRGESSEWETVECQSGEGALRELARLVAGVLATKLDTGHRQESVEFHFGRVCVLGFVDRSTISGDGERQP
jgi:hypothetical protein